VNRPHAGADAMARELEEFRARMAEAAQRLRSLGPLAVGPSPREAIARIGRATLWRYPAKDPRAGDAPLLIVYSLVNRPYMLDLESGRSLIGALTARGHSVHLLDWGSPARADRNRALADYVALDIGRAIEASGGGAPVDLVGVCQGGTFALCHAALFPERVRRLALLAAPVDFATPGNLLTTLARGVDVDSLAAVYGNVPGSFLNAAFLALRPLRLTLGKYRGLAKIASDSEALANFLRMEQWIFDSPDQPGAAFAEFVRSCYQQNRLVHGTLVLGGRLVDLRRIDAPILNVYALRDHLVPSASSLALEGRTGSRGYRSVGVDTGHVGLYVGREAQAELPGILSGWLRERA
jgi:polyhydroxyalkanoate synthase subunit PhaC